jgi:ATP-dependent Clp protease ATP-binding subunit ClpB
MNLQKFTEKAQEAVLTARQIAEDNNNSQIEPLHLLFALVQQNGCSPPRLLVGRKRR